MPQIGWFEILIIVTVAIIVIGPKDFPNVVRKIGSWIGTAKKYIRNIQEEFTNLDEDNSDLSIKDNNNQSKKKKENE